MFKTCGTQSLTASFCYDHNAFRCMLIYMHFTSFFLSCSILELKRKVSLLLVDDVNVIIILFFSFGYVEFDSVEDAQSAMTSMDGKELDGRFLRLDFAEPRNSTPGSGGGRGGGRGGRGGGRGGFGGRGGGRGGFGGRGGRGGGRGKFICSLEHLPLYF